MIKYNKKLLWFICTLGLLAQSCDETDYGSEPNDACKTPGFVKCNNTCIDPMNSNEYCGANTYCEGYNACNNDQTCQNGKCLANRPISCNTEGYVMCNGTCIDPTNSNEYCGANTYCEGYKICNKDEICQTGKCIPTKCPDGQHLYQNTCEPDSVTHCGEHDYQCAHEINGWLNGECTKGQCSVTECTNNYHLYNHTCELDTKEHCGEHGLDCRISMTGFLDGQCVNHDCIATDCIQNYHLYQNICEPDDENHCGLHTTNCPDLQGYATGACVAGECHVYTCTAGYHLDTANNRCIADTNDCCGTTCSPCTSPNVCSLGGCILQCEEPLSKCNNECHNYTNDINHCGGCNTPCTTDNISDSTNVTCTDSICKAISCRSGYHVYDGKCEKDTVENCGEHGTQCNIANATSSVCTNGLCEATECKTDYHVYNGACEANSNSNCGMHGIYCNVANATNTCSNGKCTYSCYHGYHIYDKTCEIDNDHNCGEHNKKCGVGYTCKERSCVKQWNIGDIITFGHYEQDGKTTNGSEPIEWRVLDVNAQGRALVISDKSLERQEFNKTWVLAGVFTWDKSTIRSWLNGYEASYNKAGINYTSNNFIDTAFTGEEKKQIYWSDVPAHEHPNYNYARPGNATHDRIFLLSVVEVNNYFPTNTARQAYNTSYAEGYDCSINDCLALWWLRTPGSLPSDASNVSRDGSLDYNVVQSRYGVRPAMWLKP